jgi:hypothetical protein
VWGSGSQKGELMTLNVVAWLLEKLCYGNAEDKKEALLFLVLLSGFVFGCVGVSWLLGWI